MTVQIANITLENADEKYVEMSHGTTRYIDAGEGYPTILLHGVGYAEGAHNWFLNIGPLSQRLRVIAVDALAWGKGEGWLQQEYSFAYLVDFLREFQDALGLERTNLVGHSMGGWIASLFGYESPHRLNKLVLVASGGAMPRQLRSMVEFKPPTRDEILAGLQARVKADVDSGSARRLPVCSDPGPGAAGRLPARAEPYEQHGDAQPLQHRAPLPTHSRPYARGLGQRRRSQRLRDGSNDPGRHPWLQDGGL